MTEPIILPKQSKLHPLLEMLPEHLKDTRNYFKIKAEIYKTIATNCGHDSIAKMAECEKCSKNMMKRRLLLKKLGFKNPPQYHAWQHIHEKGLELYPEEYVGNDFYSKKKYL